MAAGTSADRAAATGFAPEGTMRHDWVFDVLSDLQDYAAANGLPDLAAKVAETLVLAEHEIAAAREASNKAPLPLTRAH